MSIFGTGLFIIDNNAVQRGNELVKVYCLIDGLINFDETNNKEVIFKDKIENVKHKIIEIPKINTKYKIEKGIIDKPLFEEYKEQLRKLGYNNFYIVPIKTENSIEQAFINEDI